MSQVVHFEINADDPERAIKFYSDVFGWNIDLWTGPAEYWLVNTGQGINGGHVQNSLQFSLKKAIS